MLIYNMSYDKKDYFTVGELCNKFLQKNGCQPLFANWEKQLYYYQKTEELEQLKQKWLQAHSSFNI